MKIGDTNYGLECQVSRSTIEVIGCGLTTVLALMHDVGESARIGIHGQFCRIFGHVDYRLYSSSQGC
jgi:hypothetical protein